jgi:hypothetical protein
MLSMGWGSPLRSQKIIGELPPAVCHDIKKNLPRDLTKVGQKELLDQFLNAAASLNMNADQDPSEGSRPATPERMPFWRP